LRDRVVVNSFSALPPVADQSRCHVVWKAQQLQHSWFHREQVI